MHARRRKMLLILRENPKILNEKGIFNLGTMSQNGKYQNTVFQSFAKLHTDSEVAIIRVSEFSAKKRLFSHTRHFGEK